MFYLYVLIFCSFLIGQDVYGGYTLFSPGGMSSDNLSYLVDVDGTVYNSWRHESGPASMPYLYPGEEPGFENTLLYYPCKVNNPSMSTGGVGGKVEIYNWEGDKLWEFELSDNTYQHHHDIDVLPNGNILMIAWERKYASDWESMGRNSVNNSLNQMWSTAILEIEPNLVTGEAEIVWEWHLWDHLIQDRGSNYNAFYGEISDHPELMDINCGNVGASGSPGSQSNGDWMHFNAIDYNSYLDQIVLSSRFQNEIYIIDHSTTTEEAATHSGGNSGMGGDFLYRWGNPQNYGRGDSSNRILLGQHGVNWIEEDYPGRGNLLIFNNEHSLNSSAVIEIITPVNQNGNYDIIDDNPFGPFEIYWQYEDDFFAGRQSGAFRLINGNTLITEADNSLIFEVTEQGQVVWEYEFPEQNVMIARADKYGYDFFSTSQILGDVNGDEFVNVIDVICTVNVVLGIDSFVESADINSDGNVNVVDVVYLVDIIL